MSQKGIREFDGKRLLARWCAGKGAPGSSITAPRVECGQLLQVRAKDVLEAQKELGKEGKESSQEELGARVVAKAGRHLQRKRAPAHGGRSNPGTPGLAAEESELAWLTATDGPSLVAKPDVLLKRRGKANLVLLKASLGEAVSWIGGKAAGSTDAGGIDTTQIDTYLVEPFCPHEESDEHYVCVRGVREGHEVIFAAQGGVAVGEDVESTAKTHVVPVDQRLTLEDSRALVKAAGVEESSKKFEALAWFLVELVDFCITLHFSYCEINPFVVSADGSSVFPLDMAAKVDQTAEFEVGDTWEIDEFPPAFGRTDSEEERYIASLDAKTGASLKLTLLNPHGKIWTMIAGGGASVVFTDAIVDLGFGDQLCNYGEYSGDPNEALTFEYANTILTLLTRDGKSGKILIIGGGIANFTNVAETFKGIIRALETHKDALVTMGVKIFVRRGGPNYQQGLQAMRDCGSRLGIPIDVFGPEGDLAGVVAYALGKGPRPQAKDDNLSSSLSSSSGGMGSKMMNASTDNLESLESGGQVQLEFTVEDDVAALDAPENEAKLPKGLHHPVQLFDRDTKAVVYGMQVTAVQNMLDFDHVCSRDKPSVTCIIYPFAGGNHYQKFYWGSAEVLIPVYKSMSDALKKHPNTSVMVNFASFRSVFDSVTECIENHSDQIRTIAIIAEGVPENHTKSIIRRAAEKKVSLIGPATVGGIKPGCFRVGNTGGMIENILASRLYRPGSVAYVSRSGGMSNELNNMINLTSNGVYEGIAIGGDKYPGTVFIDHILRFEANPRVSMIVLLGEVGGQDEYAVADAVRAGIIKKPIVAWCMGTCAPIFGDEVQFGHAGASASRTVETAAAKNAGMREAGMLIPENFAGFAPLIKATFDKLVESGTVVLKPEPAPPVLPMDFNWARKLGLVRKPTSFMSSISDDRGDELLYAGVPISNVFEEELGLGGVISLLWFKRRLPPYLCTFIETVLMIVADHGPAVSGAHNTIVTARAGKDLISALVAGLVTIGPRFGGAIDGAATGFCDAYDRGLKPKDYVAEERKKGQLIAGIGHKVKSVQNPDKRVEIITRFAFEHFPSTDILQYALAVEKVTTAKKSNLILNVDGAIGACFVDGLRGCGAFTRDEADKHLNSGCLNGLFVLGRSVGLIGHYLDQQRLQQPLYRHATDDIAYIDLNQ
jgi:ATP citrate (pro-S)-lyase